jgi:hypothetical protein
MAKRRGRKTKAIREYLADHPDAASKEVVAALIARRIRVTSQMVSTLRARMAGSAADAGRPTAKGRKETVQFQNLIAAKKAAERAGGIDQLSQAMAVLAQLR